MTRENSAGVQSTDQAAEFGWILMETYMPKKISKVSNSLESRLSELLAHTEAVAATGATYSELWNAVFGIGARYGQLFSDRSDRDAIEKMPAMAKIKAIMKKAPRPEVKSSSDAKTGRLLLRIPRTLHQSLADEADTEGVSLNQLILTKLSLTLGQAVARS